MQTSIDKAFQQLKVKVPSAEHSLRDQAFSYFKDKGLPTRKDENWKYTSLAFLTKSDWGLPQTTRNFDQSLLHPDFFHIVFVNGQYQAELSDSVPGLRIEESDLVPRSFKSGMTALNWAMTPKAIKITVEKSVSITKP